MNKLAALAKSDPIAEIEGIEVDFCPDGETHFRCTLARAGGSNNAFHKALEEATRAYRSGGVDLNRVDFTKQRNTMAGVIAKTVIKGWREEDFGVPFSAEAAEDMFKEVPDFLEFCIGESNKAGLYRMKNLGDVSGN